MTNNYFKRSDNFFKGCWSLPIFQRTLKNMDEVKNKRVAANGYGNDKKLNFFYFAYIIHIYDIKYNILIMRKLIISMHQ